MPTPAIDDFTIIKENIEKIRKEEDAARQQPWTAPHSQDPSGNAAPDHTNNDRVTNNNDECYYWPSPTYLKTLHHLQRSLDQFVHQDDPGDTDMPAHHRLSGRDWYHVGHRKDGITNNIIIELAPVEEDVPPRTEEGMLIGWPDRD